jgi:hypothetical protein
MAQIKKQNKLGKDSRKISLRDFVWNGFNYTVTITFASSFGVLTATDHLGLNLI